MMPRAGSPRSDAVLIELDDGTWVARIFRPGQALEVAGVTRAEATERLLMILAELDGDER